MHTLTKLFIRLFAKKVGEDTFGNTYYQSYCAKRSFGRPQRYVVYNGQIEGSKVPQEWFLWLHHRTNTIPAEQGTHSYRWEKQSIPNLSGTKLTYYPSGHSFAAENYVTNAKLKPLYETWRYNQN